MDLTGLRAFRVALYQTFQRSEAVLMNIIDALLLTPQARSAIEVTLSPAFARAWPSFYQGLQQGHLHPQALRHLFCTYLPSTPGKRLVLAVDPTSVLRPASPTARDRMAVHAANLPEEAKPIGIGWQFSAVVVTPEQPSSWSYYLACTRIRSGTTPAHLAVRQLASLRPRLPAPCGAQTHPLVLGDRYFGSATFVLHPGLRTYDKLVRIQRHRLFYRLPPPRQPGQRGRSRKRGDKFQPKDPTTYGAPSGSVTTHDARGREVCVTAWTDLYFGGDLTRPVTILRCVRQEGPASKRDPRDIWLAWESPATPTHPAEAAPLSEVPTLYSRRFSIEHTFRFDKQSLLWDDPRVRTPTQFQRWTDLLTAAHNTLVLLQGVVEGVTMPWERQSTRAATPQQIRRAFAGIYPKLGTPAPLPQPRGKSPGRAPGTRVTPAKRYPIVRKTRAPAAANASPAA